MKSTFYLVILGVERIPCLSKEAELLLDLRASIETLDVSMICLFGINSFSVRFNSTLLAVIKSAMHLFRIWYRLPIVILSLPKTLHSL